MLKLHFQISGSRVEITEALSVPKLHFRISGFRVEIYWNPLNASNVLVNIQFKYWDLIDPWIFASNFISKRTGPDQLQKSRGPRTGADADQENFLDPRTGPGADRENFLISGPERTRTKEFFLTADRRGPQSPRTWWSADPWAEVHFYYDGTIRNTFDKRTTLFLACESPISVSVVLFWNQKKWHQILCFMAHESWAMHDLVHESWTMIRFPTLVLAEL